MARATRSSAAKVNEPTSDTKAPQQLSSPPATPAPAKKSATKVKGEQASTPATARKRSRIAVKREDGDVNELPHNLGTAMPTPGGDDDAAEIGPLKKRTRSAKKASPAADSVKGESDEAAMTEETPKKTPNKSPKKSKGYGLTPGVTPFPDYERPTPSECKEVVRLLEKVHGKVTVPKAIPPPSLDVAGCGEVPSVLDALIRTRLSANTTNKNSSTAFQGLVKTFGVIDEGIGNGSVDWDKVRRAPFKEVFHAIERGGLANVKAKDIQAILQIAYEQNQERKEALQQQDTDSKPAGVDKEPGSEKQAEIDKASANIISLDHFHLLSTDDAMTEMLKLPGIGPKTASCVALFCLQRPSFAVDTHVFRLCQYLGWVPKSTKKGQPKVDRNTTYSHCDVRIPDEYKYPLHQLLIKHGKICPRCRAATGQSSANWDEGCPIEHLVKRHGSKKGGMSQADRKKAKQAADGSISMEADVSDAGEGDASDGENDEE